MAGVPLSTTAADRNTSRDRKTWALIAAREATRRAAVGVTTVVVRRHERDYTDIRRHLRTDHGVPARGAVRLATFIHHRCLHTEGCVTVEHDHAERTTR